MLRCPVASGRPQPHQEWPRERWPQPPSTLAETVTEAGCPCPCLKCVHMHNVRPGDAPWPFRNHQGSLHKTGSESSVPVSEAT